MDRTGPGPSGPGPDVSALEAARLRVYRPDASPEDRGRYAELLAAQAREQAAVPPARAPLLDAAAAVEQGVRVGRPRWRAMAVVVGTGLVVLALAIAILLPRGPDPLPEFLTPPASTGTTLTTIARQSDPRTAPNLITYTPEGYTVFQPSGRAVQVSLRCQGSGTVVIAAGRPFVFHCGARVAVLRLAGPATSAPFVVIGTTHGNVVWAARITAA